MPRGDVNRNACTHCRRKRKKCNGNLAIPCSTCLLDKTECILQDKRPQTKADLKGEISRLNKVVSNHETVLLALQREKTHDAALSYLNRGDKVEDVAAQLAAMYVGHRESPAALTPGEEGGTFPHLKSETKPPEECSPLRSLKNSSPSAASESLQSTSSGSQESHAAVAAPHSPENWEAQGRSSFHDKEAVVGSEASFSDTPSVSANWITAPLSATAVSRLLSVFFTSGFFPVLEQETFMRDFTEGSGPYCSAALVNVMLALASRLCEDALRLRPWQPSDPITWSRRFFEEAMQELAKLTAPYSHIADIQAVALCSLFHLYDGFEDEARALARQSVGYATTYASMDRNNMDDDEHHSLVRDTTLCGTVSLARIMTIALAQSRQVSGTFSTAHVDGESAFDPLESCIPTLELSTSSGKMAIDDNDDMPQPYGDAGLLDMCNLFYKITELAYLVKQPVEPGPNAIASANLLASYHQCLEWYDDASSFLHMRESHGPFTILVDMHYHFCLMTLWRSSLGLTLSNTNASPRTICFDASKAILMLARAPEGYTQFQPVPYLMPYFVHAAGVLQLHLLETLSVLGAGSPQVRETTLEMRRLVSEAIGHLDKIGIRSKFSALASKKLSAAYAKWRVASQTLMDTTA
ncbi:hypothetical protein N3K66_006315 [Trichothecium roseum]|uniref:Uncharacterized protein n=1 Tax=Trichothecium roseum TaxID=47278 RepID=A0ACC0UWP4_9HYPO|nr:hypothetical protein N3K66_006315 [Trichothecium roseum]